MKKRKLALLLTVAMIISMFPFNAFATEFSDMPDDWSTKALENAVVNGLLKGDDGKIMPKENLTRAQMATIVNRAFGTTEESSIDDFTDVKKDDWYYDEMSKAVQMKTFIGSGDKLYPNNNITREESFVVLARAFKLSGANENTLDKFSDKNNISDWAKDSVSSLVAAGYISGSNGQVNPKQNITRQEFAQMMDNLIKNYINTEGTYTTDYSGNLMINVANVTLKGLTITGDLIIGDGVGNGTVTLDGVTVTGRTVVRGGGENSIRIIGNSNIQNIIIARVDGVVRVYSEDGTEIGEVIVDGSDDIIIEGTFGTVTLLASNVTVTATDATVESATVEGEDSKIVVEENSTINTITVTGQGTTIEGKGKVVSVEANANDITVNTPGTSVTAGEGTTGVTLGGNPVQPGETVIDDTPVPEGGIGIGGGSSGSSRVAVSGISVDVEAITLGIGETVTITATVEPSNATRKTVTWTSSDANIATVDATGVVTAVATGEATITATAGGKTAEAVITVLPVATGEEAEKLLEWFVGWPTLRFHSEERGNYVGYDFKLKEGKISELSDLTVSIYKDDEKIVTNTLINPSNWVDATGLSGSFYTNDIKKTSSWKVEQISGALGEDIFNKLVLRAVYGENVYIVDQAEVRPIEGNVKNLTQYKGYDTIQEAIADAADDDVIVVAQGVYEENLEITKPITLKSLVNGETTIGGNITIQADNVTIDGFKVEETDTTAPVIHIIDSDDVNIINNTVIAQGYASIGTSTGPARVTGKISGNTVTGMIIVGTDGELEVSNNDVTLTPTSSEGICFHPVEPTAEITVINNEIYQVEDGFAQIKVEQKPESVNGKTNEVDILSAISEDNNDATVKLAWIKTVGEVAYANYSNIQEAVDAATTGDNIIVVYPGEYGIDSIDIVQKEGVNITLEAVGEVVLKNQIQIDGGGRYEAEDTLTIRGFTFDFSDTEGDIITTANIESQDRVYAHNVTFEDCTFIGNKDNNKTVVAVRAAAKGGHTNFAFKNCRGLDLHSMGQLTSVTGVTVEDCTVENASEGGFNLPNCDDITIKNSTVYGTPYGVRTGPGGEAPNKEGQMTVSDSYLEAEYPIWLRKGSPEKVEISDTELEVVGDDGQQVKNEAGSTVTIDGAYYVTTEEELRAALDEESINTIILADGINFNGFRVSRGLTIKGGTVISGPVQGERAAIYVDSNDQVIIQGVTLVSDDEYNVNGIVTGGKAKVSIIESTFENLNIGVYFNPDTEGEVKYCEFINIKKAVGVDTDKTVTIIGNTGTNVDIGIEDFRSTVVERDNNWGMERAKALTLTANSTEDELDNTPIDTAIQEAIATKEGVAVSQDGTDLPAAGTYWVTQMDMDALDAAIANAEAAKESAKTQQDVTNIVEELEAAVSTFNDAKREAIDAEEIEEPVYSEEPAQGEE